MKYNRSTFIYSDDLKTNVELTELQLSHDDRIGYYLSACYRVENEAGVKDIYIPKMELPIDTRGVRINFDYETGSHTCSIGIGPLRMCQNSAGHYMWEQVIEEKTHEMTLEEIEEKLGYKVKLVTSK